MFNIFNSQHFADFDLIVNAYWMIYLKKGGLWTFYQFSDQNEMIADAKKKSRKWSPWIFQKFMSCFTDFGEIFLRYFKFQININCILLYD